MPDLLQVSDLEKAKLHDTFHSEVVTGKAGGLSTGANIDYATNAVTGQAQKTLPKVIDDLGWSYVGSFADGVTFTDKTDFAIDAVGTQWIYTGSLPFSATAGTVPSEPTYQAVHVKSASAISNANGGSVQDFIDGLAAPDSTVLVGGVEAGDIAKVSKDFTRTEIAIRPARGVVVSPITDGIVPIASRLNDGYIYGRISSDLYRSLDGVVWSLVKNIGGFPSLVLQAGDGEVVFACGVGGVRKSLGWSVNPTTATFSRVLDSLGADVLSWGLDSTGTGKIVATHYRGGVDYSYSRYVWLSTDSGNTWNIIYDLGVGTTHFHCVAFDPWENDRIWACWHRNPAFGGVQRWLGYSDNDGLSWNLVSDQIQPTTATATPYGMVFGSDDGPGGIFHIRRDTMEVQLACPLPVELAGAAYLVARYSQYDADTGMVYISLASQVNGVPSFVCASDGRIASKIWESGPLNSFSVQAGVQEFCVLDKELIFYTVLNNKERTAETLNRMSMLKPAFGSEQPHDFNTGRIFGGQVQGDYFRSVAVGPYSVAGPGSSQATAVGNSAKAGEAVGGPWCSAFGYQAYASGAGATALGARSIATSSSVAIGESAKTATNSVVIGRNAGGTVYNNSCAIGFEAGSSQFGVMLGYKANVRFVGNIGAVVVGADATANTDGVAIGRESIAFTSGGVSVGRSANAGGTNTTAVGGFSNAGEAQSTALGQNASCTATSSTAIGANATSSHTNGVAIGAGSSTDGIEQVNVGARDIKITSSSRGLVLRSPDGNYWRLQVSNAGELTVVSV